VGKKSRRRFRRLIIILGGSTFIIVWLVYMPVQLYRPFCDPWSVGSPPKTFSPHLSDLYRKHLVSYLGGTGTPYLEIGDVVFVPIIDNAPDHTPDKFGWRLIHVLIESHNITWSQTNRKLFHWSLREYVDAHADSKMAKMEAEYRKLTFGPTRSRFQHLHRYELQCNLIKMITDPDLK